jgi:hypothetical protein
MLTLCVTIATLPFGARRSTDAMRFFTRSV